MITIKIDLPDGASVIRFDGTNLEFEPVRFDICHLEECFNYIIRIMKLGANFELAKH